MRTLSVIPFARSVRRTVGDSSSEGTVSNASAFAERLSLARRSSSRRVPVVQAQALPDRVRRL